MTSDKSTLATPLSAAFLALAVAGTMPLRGFGAAQAAGAQAAAKGSASQEVVVQNDSGSAVPPGTVVLSIDPSVPVGRVKPMDAVNNGPSFSLDPNRRREQRIGRFAHYRDMHAPMARIHDARDVASPHHHMCDIGCIFPNWDADENDPASYDFALTDWYFASIRAAGTDIMMRLGNSAVQGPRQYDFTSPPKDYAKWARIAEHIIRHYNEGWAWTTEEIPFTNQFNMTYWEIWNEADLGCPASYWTNPTEYWRNAPRFWNGSPEQFFEFYTVAAKHLKGRFPDLKIGGPSVAGNLLWVEHFLAHCRTNSVPIDFFSWHIYSDKVEPFEVKAARVKKLLGKYGYGAAESVLNEWNWNVGWYGEEFRASAQGRAAPNNYKMAAFYAGVMSAMQNSSVDLLMYYDARVTTHYNALFDLPLQRPTKGYYPFYAWTKLRDLGTQVELKTVGAKSGVRATAAKGTDGSIAVFLSRYTADANVVKDAAVRIRVKGVSLAGARCHMTDDLYMHTEIPFDVLPDGSMELYMPPNAFAFVEIAGTR